jgi:hypothetical protein
MQQDGSLPRARRDGLLEETLGEELLLYDQNSHTAHCLSPIAACVWRHCDGERNVTELAELAGASKNVVADALHELREKDLLAAQPTLTESVIPGVSRREVIVRAARYGAAAAGASMIVSATAATPAMASSEEPSTCCQCVDKTNKNCRCIACQGMGSETGQEVCEKFCAKTASCSSIMSAICFSGEKCNNGVDCV